jgi:multiple sugar transport system permease protein
MVSTPPKTTEIRERGTHVRPKGTRRPFHRRKLLGRVGLYALMTFIAFIFLIPLFWAISTSFKVRSQIITPVIHWIPNPFTLENYTYVLNNPLLPIVQWFINSLLVACASTLLILILDSLAAYGYARMQFPGKNAIFAALLATLFLPGILFLVPNYLTVANLGLLNTYAGVILPGLAGVIGVFFLRQFFQTIPRELEEAALIDGANYFQIFYRIILPLSRPALVTLGVISFVASWNDFLWPLLILNDNDKLTLPPGLAQLQAQYNFQFGTMMAGAIIVAVPVLLVYVLLQRYIIRSVATTGLRG